MQSISDKADQLQQLFYDSTPVDMFKHIAGYTHKYSSRSSFIDNHDGSPAMNIQQHKQNFSAYLQRLVNAEPKS
eukprot:12425092-Karenia_brevis.AAC.1